MNPSPLVLSVIFKDVYQKSFVLLRKLHSQECIKVEDSDNFLRYLFLDKKKHENDVQKLNWEKSDKTFMIRIKIKWLHDRNYQN